MASASPRYYDVMVIGKTGQGKSTLGNKLLQVADYPLSFFKRYISGDKKADVAEGSEEIFRTCQPMADAPEDELESITQVPELVVNEETAVRVLDTPGFADTRKTLEVGLYKANLQCFRTIAREQEEKKLQIRRVLYFFPQRGNPKRVDGCLQEELQVMYHFFGEEIFKCMVIVATLDESTTNIVESEHLHLPNDVRKQVLEDESKKIVASTSKAISAVLEKVTQRRYEKIPPVIVAFLKEKGTDVVTKVKKADVIEEKVFVPEFRQTACAQCGAETVFSTTDKVLIGIKEAGKFKPFGETSCHPCFMPKYSTAEKVAGGAVHVATAGIPYAFARYYDKKIWPGFTNSEEICVCCKESPESKGCTLLSEDQTLCHTNEVRKITVQMTKEEFYLVIHQVDPLT